MKIRIPKDAQMFLGHSEDETWSVVDRLDSDWKSGVLRKDLDAAGLALPDLAPCSAMLLEITR